MWDLLEPPDFCGDKVLDWILNNDLYILSYGSTTQISQITNNNSTSNISLCVSNQSAKTSQKLAEPIGSSDHFQTVIEINNKICYRLVIPRAARWQCKVVDWSCFTNYVKNSKMEKSTMDSLPDEPNLSLRIYFFNDILISAAKIHFEKSKLSKKSKPQMTSLVRAKIRT